MPYKYRNLSSHADTMKKKAYKYRNLSSHADTMKKKVGKIVSSKYPKAQRTGKMQNPALPPVKE